MARQLKTVLLHQDDTAGVLAHDYDILLNAALADGISVVALIRAAGSIESALDWARENQPSPVD